MIIQCDDCQTRFRIGDDKVTARGVRVRCTRCGHTFVVRRAATEAAAPEGPAPGPGPGDAPGADGWSGGLSSAEGLAPDGTPAAPGETARPGGAARPGANLADSLFGDLDLEDGPPAAFAGSTDDELDAALSGLGAAGRPGRGASPPDASGAEALAEGADADPFAADAADAAPAPPGGPGLGMRPERGGAAPPESDPFEGAGAFSVGDDALSAGDDPFSAGPGVEADAFLGGFGTAGGSGEASDHRDAAFLRESDGLLDAPDPGGGEGLSGEGLSFDWGGDLGAGAPASARDDGALGDFEAPPLTDDYAPAGAGADAGAAEDDPFAGLDLGDSELEPRLAPREAPGERDAPAPAATSATSARTPLSGVAPPLGTTGTQGAAPVEAEPRRSWGALLANGLFATALVAVALGAWVAHRTGGRIDASLLSPQRVAEAFGEAGGPGWQVSRVSSGLYETRAGPPVLVVRGRLERRMPAGWPRVRVRVVDGEDREVAAAEAVAGARLTPEAVWAADPADLAPLLEAARAERPAEPGDAEPFVAVLPIPAGGLEGTRIRAEVRPAPGPARVGTSAPGETSAPAPGAAAAPADEAAR